MEGGAMLDPAGRRIVGFAHRPGGRVSVEMMLDDKPVRWCLATAPASVIGKAGFRQLGPPPTAVCGFEMRVPRDATGDTMRIMGDGRELLAVAWRSEREISRYREGSEMTDSVTIEKLRLHAGVFRARVIDDAAGKAAPEIAVCVRGEEVGTATLEPQSGGVYTMTATVPGGLLADGVMVVEFRLADGSALARYPLAAGAALAGDIAAEVESLRAEMDQLKRAFRQALAGGVISRDERPMIVAEALVQVDHLLEMRDRLDMRQSAMAPDELWSDDDASWDIEQ